MADRYDVEKAIEGIKSALSLLSKCGCIISVLKLDTSKIDEDLDGLKEAKRILESKARKEGGTKHAADDQGL